MKIFSQDDRQRIIDKYIEKHGNFDAAGFLREVRLTNGSHEAWNWFEWDEGKAAEAYRVQQARMFVQGLRVKFEVIETARKTTSVRVLEAPSFLSPLDGRSKGGGYVAYDPDDPTSRAELAAQAEQAFDSFVRRYGTVLEGAGPIVESLRKHISKKTAVAA